jgi:tRNA1Val (adenine37-N6)-methyltransferase
VPIHPDETQDRLTSKLRIIQKRRGHRAASDDMLLAWAAARARPDATRVLDLGSGKGTVAMLLLQRLPRCRVIGLEALELSHDLALRNAGLNNLGDRWEPRLGDLRDPFILAGEPSFDLITGAPPFMPVGSGVMPQDPQRAAGRFELRGGVREYAEAAARNLAPCGRVVLLMDGLEKSRTRAEKALAAAGLFTRTVTAVHPDPGRNPIYRILEASKESGSMTEESICLRLDAGKGFSPEYESIRREMDCAVDKNPEGVI